MLSGSVKLLPVKRGADKKKEPRLELMLTETAGASAVNIQILGGNIGSLWHRGKYVVAESQDQCKVGAWVYAKSPFSVSETSMEDFGLN
jgi:hypothetical protein